MQKMLSIEPSVRSSANKQRKLHARAHACPAALSHTKMCDFQRVMLHHCHASKRMCLSRPASRSGRFVKPRRGASLALASVILALGAGPLLPETTFRATAEASATAIANPRRRTRTLRYFGAGLARRASRNNFPGDGQSFCDSLPRARFRRFGAGVAGRASRN